MSYYQPLFNSNKKEFISFLSNQKPIIVYKNNKINTYFTPYEFFTNDENVLIIPPLNTDIRFSSKLNLHLPTNNEKNGISQTHPFFTTNSILYNPKDYIHPAHTHEHGHIHQTILDNFSWAIVTSEDSKLDIFKKGLIKKTPSSQYACGSCWAVSFADTMSDCLVVSGAVNWSPNISATYIMMYIPNTSLIHDICGGGNPAAVAKYLEGVGVADTSCIDYSWCTSDEDGCKRLNSSQHFDAVSLTKKLNSNLPKPCGCYNSGEKYMYKIDKNSEVFYINDNAPVDVFRNTVKSHILDFGPVIGGYVVLKNFISGIHTNINFNGGVYFDRADYSNYQTENVLTFNDIHSMQSLGFHAISIVGWGIARNIQYDNNKWGDVPFWHCRNSWGKEWGNDGGFFRCAMYPFNKISQFDKQVMTSIGGPVGSIILIRATQYPEKKIYKQISSFYNSQIKNRLRPETYYNGSAEDVEYFNRNETHIPQNNLQKIERNKNIPLLIGIFFLTSFLIVFKNKKHN